MSGGTDSPVGNPPGNVVEGATARRRRDKGHVSKACFACRTAKTKCDSLQPRCSHCEIRDLVCDYSWEQKPRGPTADPLSARSARRRRRLERNIYSDSQPIRHHQLPRDSPESDSSASSHSRASPHHASLPINVKTPSTPALGDLLSLGNMSLGDSVPAQTLGHAYQQSSVDPLLTTYYDPLVVPPSGYNSSDPPSQTQYSTYPPSASLAERSSLGLGQINTSSFDSSFIGEFLSQPAIPHHSAVAHPEHQNLFSSVGTYYDTTGRAVQPVHTPVVNEMGVLVDPVIMNSTIIAQTTNSQTTGPTLAASHASQFHPVVTMPTGLISRDSDTQTLATYSRIPQENQPSTTAPHRIATPSVEDLIRVSAASSAENSVSVFVGPSPVNQNALFQGAGQSRSFWDVGGFPSMPHIPSLQGFALGGTYAQPLASGHIPLVSTGALPQQLSLFDDLPPLPSSEVINEIVFKAFEDAQAGENLFSFSIIHRPTFFARLRSGTADPLLLLSVLCLGCRQHPARDAIRPIFSRRAARYLKWATETAKQSGSMRFSTFQALILWTTYVMADMGRLTSGQSWITFTFAIAKAMRLDVEVDASAQMDWIEREERRRGWWWCWCFDSIVGIGSRSQPKLPDMQPTILLPCTERYFNLDPTPTVPPENNPSWIAQADPPLFMESEHVSSEKTKDHLWLLFAGMAKQCRTVLRLMASPPPSGAEEALLQKRDFETHAQVSGRLLSVFPPGVRLLASDEAFPGALYVYQGWFDGVRNLPSSVTYSIAVMAIMVYSSWLIPMGPRTKNMLEDIAWVGSERFPPCMELANACTRLIDRLSSAVPTFPLPGTAILFPIFQIGVIHLLCVKHALAKAPITRRSSFTPEGTSGQQGVLLSEVLNSIGTTSWTSDPALNTIVIDSLAKADVHGRVLKIHAAETKTGEGVWNLWEAMLKDAVPVISALGSLELTERVIEVNPEEYQD